MSNKRLKPEANQLPLTKYVKANNNNNIVAQDEVEKIIVQDPSVSPNNMCKKRKNPCKSNSPTEKISPPNKKATTTTTSIMSEEEYNKMESKLHTNLSTSLTTSLTESLTESLKESMQGMIDASLAGAIETMNNASAKMIESSTAMKNESIVVRELKEENQILNKKLFKLETAHNKLASKVSAIENRSLENNLIIKGIYDEKWGKGSGDGKQDLL